MKNQTKKNALENKLNGQTGVRKAYFAFHVNNFLKKKPKLLLFYSFTPK